ncbi:Integrase catalytic domain-containing protein [Citrus sinensis]|uniref:Integrase catalytic domain-containing protein n=1 Tax=Citrus sinensis TaxID=2711 RepID=A0ACB8KEA3_CITSI|nr:Integrase catalytic domain-containing protein [Citrus sinensis]
MDALIQIELDVVLKNKRHLYDEEIWDRMNEKAYGQIRSCLTKEVKYLVKDEECAVTLWRTLEEKVSMHDYVSRFEKLLADLKNIDEDIKDEVNAMILLHSLPEEYSHFVTTLIYEKSVIVFKDVCTVLTNLEIRNNDKNSERASSEALVSRDWAMEKKKKRGGKNSRSKSRSRNIARDECAFCHEKGHWRKDCPKAQKRYEKKPAAANMARKDEGSDYSLSITPTAYVASSSEWILDTGVTYHLCPIKKWFTDFRNLESGAVVIGNNQPCHTIGIGTIRLKMFDRMVRELKEVRFVPALKKNLISVGALEAKGYKVTIEDDTMKFTHGAIVILQGVRHHNLYYLKGGTTNKANVVEAHSDTTKLWHVRLGHAGEKSLQTLMRHELLKSTKTCKLNFCEHCVVGKKSRVKFGTANHDTREILEYVHSDNGVAERMNRTLLEKVRCMLSNAGLDKKFWAEAVSYTSHLVNQLPSAAIGGKTPMEMWSGKHAQDYDSLRIFGCPAYYHVKNGKLDPRARKAIFVGFKVSSTSKKGSTMEVTPRVEEEVVSSDVPQNEETIDDVNNDDFIATKRPIREIKKPGWLTKDMVVAYALPVIDYDIPNTFASKNRNEIERLKKQLASEFEMKDLGDAQRILGMEIRRDKKNGSERDYMARVPYTSVVGSLIYAMVCTRSDISQAVSMVSRYMHNPDKRRSTTGYVFTLGGSLVSWRSILQSTIAMSSTEAEYMAATEAVKEAIWLRGLLGDFGKIQKNINVFCDNQSAIFLAKNQISFDYVEAFSWETGTTVGLIPTFGYVGSRIDAANVDSF